MIEAGSVFTGKWFTGRIEVMDVDEENNQLVVWLTSKGSSQSWEEKWNLQHVVWGFERGDYFFSDEYN